MIADNLCKGLLDGMQDAGVYLNDSQITTLVVKKRKGGLARALVSVEIDQD